MVARRRAQCEEDAAQEVRLAQYSASRRGEDEFGVVLLAISQYAAAQERIDGKLREFDPAAARCGLGLDERYLAANLLPSA